MTEAEKLIKIAENEQLIANANIELEEALYSKSEGGKSWYDKFWDSFQVNGTRRNYINAFSGVCWKDDTYNPKYEIIATSPNSMFAYNSNITSTKVPITISASSAVSIFTGCSSLITIPSIKVSESTTFGSWFTSCKKLENIAFTEDSVIGNSINLSPCPLTAQSLVSVVEHLSDTATGNTVTFNKAAKEAAFTDDEWATLIAIKPNWTFSLV